MPDNNNFPVIPDELPPKISLVSNGPELSRTVL
jgi:hypothetical protein